jgi:hypothetical protein
MRALFLLLVPATAFARPSLPAAKHVTIVSKCGARLEPAPQAEQEDLRLRARKQLRATEVTLWDLGDSVRSVDVPALPGHPRTLSGRAAQKAASDYLVTNAKLFGLEPRLDKIKSTSAEENTERGGWTIAGKITRTFEKLTETEGYTITFDTDGHIASVRMGPTRLLPAVPLCKKTTLRPSDPAVLRTVIGQPLVVHAIGRDLDGGVVTLKNIGRRYPIVIQHGDTELVRAIAVEVKSSNKALARASWTFYVDGDTGAMLEQSINAPPDI